MTTESERESDIAKKAEERRTIILASEKYSYWAKVFEQS